MCVDQFQYCQCQSERVNIGSSQLIDSQRSVVDTSAGTAGYRGRSGGIACDRGSPCSARCSSHIPETDPSSPVTAGGLPVPKVDLTRLVFPSPGNGDVQLHTSQQPHVPGQALMYHLNQPTCIAGLLCYL